MSYTCAVLCKTSRAACGILNSCRSCCSLIGQCCPPGSAGQSRITHDVTCSRLLLAAAAVSATCGLRGRVNLLTCFVCRAASGVCEGLAVTEPGAALRSRELHNHHAALTAACVYCAAGGVCQGLAVAEPGAAAGGRGHCDGRAAVPGHVRPQPPRAHRRCAHRLPVWL